MGDIFVACSVKFDVGGKGCCYTFCVLSQDLPIPSSREDNWNYTKSGLSLNSFPTSQYCLPHPSMMLVACWLPDRMLSMTAWRGWMLFVWLI